MTTLNVRPDAPVASGAALRRWSRIERVTRMLLLATVVAVAAIVARDFVHYTDYFPYLALDDALGNVSYSLASHGQYGFPSSPIQAFTNVPRNRGFSNYGPWYFYAGAALIWLFGYSIGLLRSLHLLGILAIGATACWWFGRRRQFAAGALIALGLLYSFDVGQWPMVRPDIAVSVFAVMFIVAAGRAIENGLMVAWFAAGVAAGCAALTHLIAWALVPCCFFTLAVALWSERPGKRRALVAMLAVVAGFAAAATMFYGSFGFRVRDHLAGLRGYGGYLSDVATGDSRSVLATHLRVGFWFLSRAAGTALAGGVLASVGLLLVSWRWPRASRAQMLAVLLPPAAVLCFYLGSLISYANYHAGYGILPQVAALWCVGALLSTLLWLVERRSPAASRAFAAVAALLLVVAGAAELSTRVRADSNPRLAYAREWVGIHNYTARIGELVPQAATAWGAPIFGIDSPGRFELVDVGAALSIVERARLSHPVDASRIAPAYLIWGYGDNRDNTTQALDPRWIENFFNRVHNVLDSVRYRLVGLVAAAPYGVTRVYQRVLPSDNLPRRLPVVSVYDSETQLWDGQLEGPLPVRGVVAAPAVFDLRFGPARGPVQADRTMTVELPAGRYLLRVHLRGAKNSKHPSVMAVSSSPSISAEVGELGPAIDVSPYAEGDEDAYLIHSHVGGPLYVSQLDKGYQISIDDLEVFRIRPSLHDDQRADRNLFAEVPLAPWASLTSGIVRANLTKSGALDVTGDATRGGYQITSQALRAAARSLVTLRPTLTLHQGHVCIGALNGAGEWLTNGGDPSEDFKFTADETAAFRIVIYNCNAAESGNTPSRFTLSRMRYAVREPGTYVDGLLAVLNPSSEAPAAVPPAPATPAAKPVTAEAVRITIPLGNADVQFRAPILLDAREGWRLKGQAEARFSYVLRFKPGQVTDYRLVAKGVLMSGGITVGLLKDDKWARYVSVTAPGPFTAVVEPPISGATYEVLIANDISDGPLTTDVLLEHIGWAPLASR